LGSDIPFCIGRGTAIATGRGEQLDPLPGGEGLWLVLGKDKRLAVSTPWAYQTYRQQFQSQYLQDADARHTRRTAIHAGPLVQAILQRDGAKIANTMHNDLEKVVLPHYPGVAHLRHSLARLGGLGTMMSGSGPTVFTLCQSQAKAEQIKTQVEQDLKEPEIQFWVAQCLGHGIQLAEHS
jgi:4-diphosphocytidyl-2-C-methyl-D-erythritol kinase